MYHKDLKESDSEDAKISTSSMPSITRLQLLSVSLFMMMSRCSAQVTRISQLYPTTSTASPLVVTNPVYNGYYYSYPNIYAYVHGETSSATPSIGD